MVEVRLDRLSSPVAAAMLNERSVAYVPIGSIEFHGPHLPLGVDLHTAEGLCRLAAERTGGVVLPPVYLASGCLDLPHSLTFSHQLVEAMCGEVINQLHHRGVELVVLVTGHGPLDLIHLLKRVAGESDRPGSRAYALCWLELNAARLQGPQTGEPTVIDHASTVETSWMLAFQPELVHLDYLPDDPDAAIPGVYGRNPRFTSTARLGEEQAAMCAELLAERVQGLAAATWTDECQDLRSFVDLAWPEPMVLRSVVDGCGPFEITIVNPGPASRYISGVVMIEVDGVPVNLQRAWCANRALGERGQQMPLDTLHRENGVYVRRQQELLVVVPEALLPRAGQEIAVELELGGVRRTRLMGQTQHRAQEFA